jgi:hypothetical protein
VQLLQPYGDRCGCTAVHNPSAFFLRHRCDSLRVDRFTGSCIAGRCRGQDLGMTEKTRTVGKTRTKTAIKQEALSLTALT